MEERYDRPTLIIETNEEIELLPRKSRTQVVPPIKLNFDQVISEAGEQTSPRSTFIKKKFPNFSKDEIVFDNFSCAFNCGSNMLLQGMLYLTNKSCYFYSPFNQKTLVG